MSKTIIKGYKGFNKDLKCRDFQYEVDKEYHTDGDIKVCDKGFHFCENPLDVWNFYPLVDGNVYHEVIGSGKIDKDENKVSVENIKIGARLDLSSFINASVNFILEKASKKKIFKNVNATSGERANSATSGERANSATSGNYANSATSGYGAHSATSGSYAHSATSGYGAHSATSGSYAHSATSGNYANSATSGYGAHSATSGSYAHSATSGSYAHSATSGNYANSATSGSYAHSATSGNYANSATSGYGAHSATIQKNTIACAIGRKAKAKGSLGSFIVIAEWYEGKEFTDAYPLCVLSAKVDNKKVKADTWYKVVKGKFVETDDSNE